MKLSVRSWNYLQVAALCLAVCAVAGMGAAKKPRLKAGQFNPDNETVEFFSARLRRRGSSAAPGGVS